jgi:CBS domain-containing protein
MRRTEYLTQPADFDGLTAGTLMERDVVTVKPDDTCRHAAQCMTEYHVGGLPVVEEGHRLVGIVTEFDLLRLLRKGEDPNRLRVEEAMSRDIRVIAETAKTNEIIALLQSEHLIRVPVVTNGKLVGIVARQDLLLGYIRSTAKYWP